MSCFRLPAPVCRKITTYISNYWWGSSVDNHKVHWLRWNKLTDSKEDGVWRLLTRLDALCSRVLKGKYFPNSDFLGAKNRRRSSETWRAILYGRDVLYRGIIKRIGPGSSVNVWDDNWIPSSFS
ncbi:hypothetical protein PAHAL_4G101000 [Panicum hallii]|uniref:Reverse transcriptase zinc-binding domain-containing protein n=1 Tax=Panicum hallii TaxID=206008 RepID=A0A2T8JCG0_9POAL|nr:hypothetical protein PAHAL_4G101000 [Panicum hallii]